MNTLFKMLAMLDELTHSDDNSIIKQHVAKAQATHLQPLQNRQRTCACISWVSSTVTAVSIGCCPIASVEAAPQVKSGESCHACVSISLETLPESVTQTASTWPAQTVSLRLNPLHQTLAHSKALLSLVNTCLWSWVSCPVFMLLWEL